MLWYNLTIKHANFIDSMFFLYRGVNQSGISIETSIVGTKYSAGTLVYFFAIKLIAKIVLSVYTMIYSEIWEVLR